MDPNKFAELQLHMKNNQAELSDYLKDLDDWTNDIKEKERRLFNSSADNGSTAAPLRNSSSKTKAKGDGTRGNKKGNESDKKKLSSYDYRAWDRFDVVSCIFSPVLK